MQNFKLLIGVIGGTLALVLVVAYLFTSQEAAEPKQADLALVQGEMRHVKSQLAELDSANEEATSSSDQTNTVLRIVEFSDFQCPACRAARPLLEQVVEQYPGRVELVYRHFPLEQIHPHARLAAIYSEVLAEQGLFWEFHDLLYDNQTEWSQASDPNQLFVGYAQEVGADTTDLATAIETPTYEALVEADIRDGFALGVQGTPTIFVDGYRVDVVNLQSYVAERLE